MPVAVYWRARAPTYLRRHMKSISKMGYGRLTWRTIWKCVNYDWKCAHLLAKAQETYTKEMARDTYLTKDTETLS